MPCIVLASNLWMTCLDKGKMEGLSFKKFVDIIATIRKHLVNECAYLYYYQYIFLLFSS